MQMPVRRLGMIGLVLATGAATERVSAQQTTRTMVVERGVAARSNQVLDKVVTISVENASLVDAMAAIANQAHVRIQYRDELVSSVTKKVTVKAERSSLRQVLEDVLMGTRLYAVPSALDVVTIQRVRAGDVAEDGVIVGKVTDSRKGTPVAGATILVDDATSGVTTGQDGAFRISVAAGSHRVTVRAVGFSRVQRSVDITAGQTITVDIELSTSASVLDEVVVTGTVIATERKAVTTPITVITAEDIERRGITRVEDLFRGEIPGVIALDMGSRRYAGDSAGSMATATMYARGASGFSSQEGLTNPLKTYIDGVEMLNSAYLGTIDPASIERIEIITGPQAATVYGSGAMGGVMQIFTKKGSGTRAPDLTLSLRYGMMESNITSSYTPVHADVLSITGGSGPEFSYSGNVSYNYSGQWQPGLYSRGFGGQVGVGHVRGPFRANGSVSVTSGRSGASLGYGGGITVRRMIMTGEIAPLYLHTWTSHRTSTSASQTLAFTTDYRPFPFWQHSLTVGKSINQFELDPSAPPIGTPSDTLFWAGETGGSRTSFSYNTTLSGKKSILGSNLTVGTTGSYGKRSSISACLPNSLAKTYVDCSQYTKVTVTKADDSQTIGGFANWQLGFFDQIFLRLALRGEHSPAYGERHKVDWTPTWGLTYTLDVGELSVKFLGSYGRATRAPDPALRLEVMEHSADRDPSSIIRHFANPNLTPEYSRGPQGGVEIYYGNLGSVMVNRYRQTVTDLIQTVVGVDSVLVWYFSSNRDYWYRQLQSLNVASILNQGWEVTGNANVGPLTFKGTYSWNDSRVTALNVNSNIATVWKHAPGQAFRNFPTHIGNVNLTYAKNNTSIMLSTNIVGKSSQALNDTWLYWVTGRMRLYMYRECTACTSGSVTRPMPLRGYTKTNLNVSQQVSPSVRATFSVSNLGNRFNTDLGEVYPSLGRQSTFGLSVRFP